MADGSLGPGKYIVPVILEMFAFSFALSSVDSFRAGKRWPDYSSAAAFAVVLSVAGFRWPWVKSISAKFNPWRQLKRAKARIDDLSGSIPPPSQLKIHSASWGSAGSRKPVLEAVKRQPKDALVLGVSNEVLGCDPAWGDDNKYIEVEYSYGDGPMLKATRKQGRLLVLPEDKQFIEDTAAEYERKRKSDVDELEKKLEEQYGIGVANREQIGQYMRELERLEDENRALREGVIASPAAQSKLIIHSAKYGPADGSAWEDVTLIVLARLKNNVVDILVSGQMFPEVFPGARMVHSVSHLSNPPQKWLIKVVYTLGDLKEHVIVRYSGERLTLPENVP